jgi:superfamily I DNA/RNA helicase
VTAVDEAIRAIAALPTPVGAQKDVLALRPVGHAVVLGTAGSGKTTMAVLRALYLSDRNCEHAGKTLLATYNKSLLAYLEHMLPPGLYDLEVRNYHHFARGYLNSRGEMDFGCIVGEDGRRRLIRKAVNDVRERRNDAVLERDEAFFVSELSWMAHHGHLSQESYLAAERVGRGQALSRASREAIFDIQETYIRVRSEEGKRYDWDDIAAGARTAFASDNGERHYRHVVVDEGQDFSPEMLRSLALGVPDDGSLTFFGDVAQQIYGRGISWRAAGLDVPKVWEFTKNYRNSPQIAALALAIVAMPYYKDQADMVAPDEFADAGPPPTVVHLGDRDAEEKFVIEQARLLERLGTVGVLSRRDRDACRIGQHFDGAQHLHKGMPPWRPEGISYGNVHSAKGYEFQSVILVGVTADCWPEPEAIRADGLGEATAIDGRLLYVAISRARQNLIMTATSALSALLPATEDLWLEQKR